MKILRVETTNEGMKKIETLVRKSDSKTKAELVRKALTLYDFCISETGLGKKILLQEEDGSLREVVIQ